MGELILGQRGCESGDVCVTTLCEVFADTDADWQQLRYLRKVTDVCDFVGVEDGASCNTSDSSHPSTDCF